MVETLLTQAEITLILKLHYVEKLSVSEIERVTPFASSLIDRIITEELCVSKDNRVSDEDKKPLV